MAAPGKIVHDRVHGLIDLSPLEMSVIDTEQFQRLRGLQQLGACSFVFPSAVHTRFEHSVGVCHLAGQLASHIRASQPELDVTARDVELVRLSGLVHDLGHGPFSHVFDGEFMTRARPERRFHHEEMSVALFNLLVEENGLDLDSRETRFVEEAILGDGKRESSLPRERRFLHQIVANGASGLDVDKLDYLARDPACLGLTTTSGPGAARLLGLTRVVGGDLAHHAKTAVLACDVFTQRYLMHKQIYSHRAGLAVQAMICDALLLADGELGLSAAVDDPRAYQSLTDHVLYAIEGSRQPALQPARELVRSIRRRELYRFADEAIVAPALLDRVPRVTPEAVAGAGAFGLRPEDVVIYDSRLTFGQNGRDHPLDRITFYASAAPDEPLRLRPAEVSLVTPEHFSERTVRVYSRSREPEAVERVQQAFRRHMGQFGHSVQPSPMSKAAVAASPARRGRAGRSLELLSSQESSVAGSVAGSPAAGSPAAGSPADERPAKRQAK